MNLFKKGIFSLLILATIITACSDEFEPLSPEQENSTGVGLNEITLSSFTAIASGDGTIITVKPLAVGGVTSYTVDFGDLNSTTDVFTITDIVNGTASYDYPNELEEAKYTITVTAKSTGKEDVSKTKVVTVEHDVTPVNSLPSSPTIEDENVYAIYTDGLQTDKLTAYSIKAFKVSFDNKTNGAAAEYKEIEVTNDIDTLGNKVIQYSRLRDSIARIKITHKDATYDTQGVITAPAQQLVVANAFGTGVAATTFHVDLHSKLDVGVDKVKIILVNNGVEHIFEQSLTDNMWQSLAIDLATGFSGGAVTQIDEIKFQLGTGGTTNDAATLNVDNIYLSKPATPISSVIINGDFGDDGGYLADGSPDPNDYGREDNWKIPSSFNSKPFNSSGDGSWYKYDGSLNTASSSTGSKTGGAKFTSSSAAGANLGSSTRIAYQSLQLVGGSDYILEYEYAIKSDAATEPIGGRRIVGNVLNSHFSNGDDIFDEETGFPFTEYVINYHLGNVAEGKFNATNGIGTKVTIPFTAPSDGKVAVLFYAVTPKDGWIDNVKVLPAP